jgi:transcriptional regulator with XRE-family HTH domain
MAGRPSTKKATPTGARLAALRRAAGLSQVQLAQAVGIPQRTLSFYEREATYLPSTLLPAMAEALGVTIEELIGVSETKARKRGPKSQLERQLEIVLTLPRQTQQKIMAVLDAFISQHKTTS